MPGWEVKRKGRVYRMERPEDLLRMAVIGQIHATNSVRAIGERQWRLAGDLEEVRLALEQDPWSAWESLGGQSPKALWKACTELVESHPDTDNLLDDEETVEAGAKTVASELTVDSPAAPPGEPQGERVQSSNIQSEPDFSAPVAPHTGKDLPVQTPYSARSVASKEHLSGKDEAPMSADAAVEHVGGEVIVFPLGGGPRRGGSGTAIALDLPDLPELEDRASFVQSRQPRRAFPWVLGTVGMVGILTMMFVNAHVRTAAMWVSPRTVTPPTTAPVEVPVLQQEVFGLLGQDEEIASETPHALREASDELRQRLSPGVIDMKGRVDDLSTALLVELSRMDLGPVKVQAPVLAWGGAHNDMPEAVDIHVLLQSRDELEWEIGAVGLVIGKYVQNYDLDVERLQVSLQSEDGTLRRIQIEPDLTRQFYRNRVDLLGFLQAL